VHSSKLATRRIGFEFLHKTIGEHRDIRVLQRGIDAKYLGIRFRMNQARETIAGIAANAWTQTRALLIEHYAKRSVKRRQASRNEIFR
jgi:hypothetical protein